MGRHQKLALGGFRVRPAQPPAPGAFARLRSHVALSALHNSGEIPEPPKCHPGTRVDVLTILVAWALTPIYEYPIRWLNGPAGAGKSAIMRSLARMLVENGLLLASFFFFRYDARRNSAEYLIPTISYQLSTTFPPLQRWIEHGIKSRPQVFGASLAVQIQTLIIDPLLHFFYDPNSITVDPFPRVILIDGLDECTGHGQQLEILGTLCRMVQTLPIPIAIVFASRPEQQIRAAFEEGRQSEISSRITLDDSFKPDEDIRRYYLDEFQTIRSTHPLLEGLGIHWPPPNVITMLVRNASGQFIYAVTVVKFIKSNQGNPVNRLQIVLGQADPGTFKPFQQLDVLYTTVFANVDCRILHDTLRVLGVIFTPPINGNQGHQSPKFMDSLLGFPQGHVRSVLLGLESLLTVAGDEDDIHIAHASLSYFLFDKLRAGKLFINRGIIYADIASSCINLLRCPLAIDFDFCQPLIESYLEEQLRTSLQKAPPTDHLRHSIDLCDINRLIGFHEPCGIGLSKLTPLFLLGLKESCYPDADHLYHTTLASIGAVVNPTLIQHWLGSGYDHCQPLLLFVLLFALTLADPEQGRTLLVNFSVFPPGVWSPLSILPGLVYRGGDDTYLAEDWRLLSWLILQIIKAPGGFLEDPRGQGVCTDLALHLLRKARSTSQLNAGYIETILPFLLDLCLVREDLITAVRQLDPGVYPLNSALVTPAIDSYSQRVLEGTKKSTKKSKRKGIRNVQSRFCRFLRRVICVEDNGFREAIS